MDNQSEKVYHLFQGTACDSGALIYSVLSCCSGVTFCSSSILFSSGSKKYLRFTRTVPIARNESGTRFTGAWDHTCTFGLGLMVLLNLHHSSKLRVVLCQVFFQIISWCCLKVIVGQDTRRSIHYKTFSLSLLVLEGGKIEYCQLSLMLEKSVSNCIEVFEIGIELFVAGKT